MIVERPEHPAINALIKWNPLPYLKKLVNELSEAELPPSMRHILIKHEDSDRIFAGLMVAQRDGRIPTNTKIINIGNGVVSIFFPLKNAKLIVQISD